MTILTNAVTDEIKHEPPQCASAADSDAAPKQVEHVRPSAMLRSLFRQHRGRLLLTYGLFNVENLLRLAQPFVLGWAINGLLRGSYVGLLAFTGQHLTHLMIGTFRRRYDTRAFTDIYTQLATGVIVQQRQNQVDVSRVTARSALSRAYIGFFEQDVPWGIRAAYSVVGAVAMLAVYDWLLIPYCFGLIVPAYLINAAYGKKTLNLNRHLHDRFEREVDVIDRGDPAEVRQHYNEVARWRIRLSDAEATNFGLMELFVLGVIIASLVHYCTNGSPQPGDIFAVFRYLMMFIMGLDTVPRLVEQMSRLRDIGFRMRARPV